MDHKHEEMYSLNHDYDGVEGTYKDKNEANLYEEDYYEDDGKDVDRAEVDFAAISRLRR